MKQMWDKKELIKLIDEYGGKITPEKLFELLNEGDNIAIELVETKEGIKVRISASGGGTITPQQLAEILKGSETIVVDLSEDEEYLEVHLDADVVAKIDRALLMPLTLSEFKLVGVDVGNIAKTTKKNKNAPEQRMIGIDNNTLEIDENNRLKVKSGGSGTLYLHRVLIRKTTALYFNIEIISNSNSPISSIETLKNKMLLNHFYTPYDVSYYDGQRTQLGIGIQALPYLDEETFMISITYIDVDNQKKNEDISLSGYTITDMEINPIS